jgi:hypothetical protein
MEQLTITLNQGANFMQTDNTIKTDWNPKHTPMTEKNFDRMPLDDLNNYNGGSSTIQSHYYKPESTSIPGSNTIFAVSGSSKTG